jgi:hypothetical protein
MTSKALKSQLLAAVAMVLVAAIALGGSTFAWFVTNSTVTANGMSVQATAENGIEIQEATTPTVWASSASGIHGTAAQLIPVSTTDATAWYHASALAKTASAVDATTFETLTLSETNGVGKIDSADTKGYYIHDTFNIRATATAASDLKVSGLTVTAGDDLAPGLRVLIKCGSNTFICAPDASATMAYNVGDARTATTALTVAQLQNQVLASTVSTSGVAVQVYIYFEGEDAAIYTDNIPATLQSLSVTLEFTATI